MSWRRAVQRVPLPKFALGIRQVHDNELAIEALAGAVSRTGEPAAITGAAWADRHPQGADRVRRNDVERALLASGVEVEVCVTHMPFSLVTWW
jgi:hypothetical protein